MNRNNILKIILIVMLIIVLFLICIIFIKLENISTDKESDNTEKMLDINDIQLKEKYECNEFEFSTITTENLLKMYLNDYKFNMVNNIEKAFNSLNKEYREKKFGGIDNYKEYVNNNIEKIKQIELSKYLINNYEDYQEYVCLDQYNNYYIFEVTAVMEYTLRLDTYTIDSKNFIDTYNNSNAQERVILNIQKIFNVLENEGYEYIYKKLDSVFKENKYKTQEDFEKDIKDNLFKQNDISFNEFTNEGDIYIYDILITNKENTNERKRMVIIMSLLEDRDFIMSYSFK